MYELIIFDWDGTLIDSESTIVNCMQGAIVELGLPARDAASIGNIIGLGLREAILQLYPEFDDAQVEALRDGYSRFFISNDLTSGEVFPNVSETLAALHGHGCHLAVATGKSRRGLDRAFSHIDWDHYFHASRCADETKSKPHPQMIHELLDQFQVPAERALMVGDTEYDMDMARQAGVDRVAVDYGVHHVDRLVPYEPRLVVGDLKDLADWVLAL